MPITNWWCGQHKAVVPLNHFDSCTYVHPDFAAAILADRELQADRAGVRVSNASACPRKSAILAAEDVAVDPLSYLTAMKGTAWHKVMEAGCEDYLWTCTQQDCDGKSPFQADMPYYCKCGSTLTRTGAEISVAGEIAGIPITGTIDRVRLVGDKLRLEDHKTGKDARVVFLRGGKSYGKQIEGKGSPIEYRVQVSLYCDLYRQQFGRMPDAAAIVWWFSAEHWSEPIEIMPVEQCLAWRPYDGGFTVEQLLRQAQSAADGSVRWQDLPLAGKEFHFGKSKIMCDYCEVRETCWVNSELHCPF